MPIQPYDKAIPVYGAVVPLPLPEQIDQRKE